MKNSDIRKLIKDIEAIDNRGVELTNKGFITMLENVLDDRGIPGMYFYNTPDQQVFQSKRYGLFVLSKIDDGSVGIMWYKDKTFNSEPLLPITKSPYKWVLDFSDIPKDGRFDDFESAEMYLKVKFGKLYK